MNDLNNSYNSYSPWYSKYLTPQPSTMYFIQDGVPIQTYEKVTQSSKLNSLRWTYHLKISDNPPKFKQIGVRKLIYVEFAKRDFPEYFI